MEDLYILFDRETKERLASSNDYLGALQLAMALSSQGIKGHNRNVIIRRLPDGDQVAILKAHTDARD